MLLDVQTARSPQVLELYWPLLLRAYARDDSRSLELSYIYQAIELGALRVWFDGDSLVTFAVMGWDAYFVHGAGKLNAILSAVPELEEFCRAHGARRALIWGRPGWERLLDDYRFVLQQGRQVLLEKRL